MPRSYKANNGRIIPRKGNGRFRRTTLEDFGIYDTNREGTAYICDECGHEWYPLVHSGKCVKCGSDKKHPATD